jgi:hypothetical protein
MEKQGLKASMRCYVRTRIRTEVMPGRNGCRSRSRVAQPGARPVSARYADGALVF